MAERFVNVDRQTPMFLPPDLREWVADNELAHLVLEAVELCDLRGERLNLRGSGSEQYPPTMMLALLIYAYATGLFSSRRIERATYSPLTNSFSPPQCHSQRQVRQSRCACPGRAWAGGSACPTIRDRNCVR